MDGKVFITVILPLKTAWQPWYYITAEEAQRVRPGVHVRVVFAMKSYVGTVATVGGHPEIDPSRVIHVSEVLDNLPVVSEEELRLWRFMAEYYMCTLGEVAKAAYPSMKASGELQAARAEARKEEMLRAKDAREAESRERKMMRLRERIERNEAIVARVRTGTKAEAAAQAVLAKCRAELAELESATKTALVKSRVESVGARQGIMSKTGSSGTEKMSVCSELAQSISAGSGSVGGNPEGTEVQDLCGSSVDNSLNINDITTLTSAQTKAFESIRNCWKDRGELSTPKPALLHGITGSGKTEIYIKAAIETLRQGRNVLWLVPEIALSRQLEERARTVFGDLLSVFHSGESPSRRLRTAAKVRCGRYVVLGTRSAIFLPFNELGLVIVDEEHDGSYKQTDNAPRYNGRDTAVVLAGIHHSRLILGSATPSMESLYNCQTGRYSYIPLAERYFGAADAEVEIIDTIAERRKRGMRGNLSLKLISRISETLESGGQVVVLRGRKAYAPAVQCVACGHIPYCPHCNVPLTYYRNVHGASMMSGPHGQPASGMIGKYTEKSVPGASVIGSSYGKPGSGATENNPGQSRLGANVIGGSYGKSGYGIVENYPAHSCPVANAVGRPHGQSELENIDNKGVAAVLQCHYCGYSEPYTGECTKCKGTYKPIGSGTQKIEEELKTLFPDRVIARLDSDVTTARNIAETVKAFEQGKIDILVGTQIVAKGFDFKDLSLVAVIGADSFIGQQDFRADERAFQLLEQAMGRCGRRSRQGRFVIQTNIPEHPVYKVIRSSNADVSVSRPMTHHDSSDTASASRPMTQHNSPDTASASHQTPQHKSHDAASGSQSVSENRVSASRDQLSFLQQPSSGTITSHNCINSFSSQLLSERKAFGFPPFTRAINLIIKDVKEERLDTDSAALAKCLREVLAENVTRQFLNPDGPQILGPVHPQVDRIADEHIRQIRISLRRDSTLSDKKALIRRTITDFEKNHLKSGGHIIIDVDPV